MSDDPNLEPDPTAAGETFAAPPTGDVAVPEPRRRSSFARRGKARRRKKADTVDVRAVLSKPLRVMQDGKPTKMDSIEAAIRQQVVKALAGKDVAAMEAVIRLAEEHGLFKEPPPERKGGVLLIPSTVSDEARAWIFGPNAPPMDQIFAFLEWHDEQLRQQ